MSLPVAQAQIVGELTLKGNAVIIKDYLSFAINSIFFQRDVYSPDEFKMVDKYGLPLMMMKDDKSISTILNDAEKALSAKGLKKVILALFNRQTDEIIEKWEFTMSSENTENNNKVGSKDIKIIQAEIRAVLKQVLGSVSFLPLIEKSSIVKILFVLQDGFSLPGWTPYHGSLAIDNSEQFVFKEFSTSLQKCSTKVTYKC